jgi:hypothetical protein
MSSASSSHDEMPSVTATNTTGDTGRNVAVPRIRRKNAACLDATMARWSSITSSWREATSLGGSKVRWVGIASAITSPKDAR